MNIILFEAAELGKPLPPQDARTVHLLKTLHKQTGDRFDAGVLGGRRGTGHIDAVTSDGALRYTLSLNDPPPPRTPIRIAVGFPRPIQLRRLLRDLSALGVEGIDLIGTDLGEKSYRQTKLLSDGGAQSALVEGAVQARDTHIPQLALYSSLGRWLEARPWVCGACIAADNIRPQGLFSQLTLNGGAEPVPRIVIAVGAERGWSDHERALLEQTGFRRLALGSRALRTETACIAAVILGMEKIGALD